MADSVFAALLAGRPAAHQLLPGRFAEPEAWRSAADRASARATASGLLDELARQFADLPPSAARDRNLEHLARAGSCAVVTGQQVGLFGGPLLTLHKAATAIARARMVEQLTGRPCVPIFWLQTEDHDYAEIAQVAIATSSGRVQLSLPAEQPVTRVSLAHRRLPPETDALIEQLAEALGAQPHAAEVLGLLRAHYVAGRPIAQAFAGLLTELWKDEGLLVLDPRTPVLARLAAPLLQRVLDQHSAIAADLQTRAQQIADAGCQQQVHTRPNASLVFFHPSGVAADRYRLTPTATGFETPEGVVTSTELRERLAREPLCFSSSALLRPLLQDSWLPTCAYLGGPAELSYFAQLPPLYERLGVPMPLIAPRARLRVIDPTMRSLLTRLSLSPEDLSASRQQLLARVAAHAGELSATDLRARLLGPLEQELSALAALGLEGLTAPIEKTQELCARTITKLAERVERAALERDTIACERIDRLLLALHPDGVPQERAYGFLALAARSGIHTLTRALLDGAMPLDPAIRDVQL